MIPRRAAVLLACSIALGAGGCSAEEPKVEATADTKAASTEPCDLLRESDAAGLLDGDVERVDYAEYVNSQTTVPVQDKAKVEAVAKRTCMYRLGDSNSTVALQLDRGLFKNEDEFRAAFGPDVEALEEPGLAAMYRPAPDGGGATNFGVLLNEDGDAFGLAVTGPSTARDELEDVASEIAKRY